MITDAEFDAWLKDDRNPRAVLVEAQTHTGELVTRYLSSNTFVSGAGDQDPNREYVDAIAEVPEFRQRIDGAWGAGAIELTNYGEMDAWLENSWAGWPLKVYIGDPRWSRDDFRLILDGASAGINSPSRDRLRIELRDRKRLLELPVLAVRQDGQLDPLGYGKVFNAQPILIDPNAGGGRYKCNSQRIINLVVRDNGDPIAVTQYLDDGEFQLGSAPVGVISCDYETTQLTAAAIVQALAERVGYMSIDTATLAAFPNTATLQLYVRDQATAGELMEEVMRTVGGYWDVDDQQRITIGRLEEPAGTAALALTDDDVVERSLSIRVTEQPVRSVSLGYKKNWTVQDAGTIAGSVSKENRDLYSRPYSTVVAENDIVDVFPQAEVPDVLETLFVNEADAQAEADRRAALRNQVRKVYQLEALIPYSKARIGQVVDLSATRFNLSGGVKALVVGIRGRPTLARTQLELWR